MPSESDKFDPADPLHLTPAERRELIRRGHSLRARTCVGRQGLTDAFTSQLDRTMGEVELLKVRIDADTTREATQLAEDLAARIGARLVQRVGRIALLYRPVRGGQA